MGTSDTSSYSTNGCSCRRHTVVTSRSRTVSCLGMEGGGDVKPLASLAIGSRSVNRQGVSAAGGGEALRALPLPALPPLRRALPPTPDPPRSDTCSAEWAGCLEGVRNVDSSLEVPTADRIASASKWNLHTVGNDATNRGL